MTKFQEDLLKIRGSVIDTMRAQLMGPGSEVSYPDAEHELPKRLPIDIPSVYCILKIKNSGIMIILVIRKRLQRRRIRRKIKTARLIKANQGMNRKAENHFPCIRTIHLMMK